jgi:replicative DNA helicase
MYVAEKLLPHNVEAEEAVIGSLLIDGESITRVLTFLKTTDFYREPNRWCYDACKSIFDRNEAINQVTVAHELGVRGHLDDVGGHAYLSHLIQQVPTSVHIEHYAQIVNRTATMRSLIHVAGEISSIGYEGTSDVETALSRAEDLLFRIRSGQTSRDFVSIREVLDQYLEDTASSELEKGSAPVPTGFIDLDRLLGGLQRSDLVILAARPSLGKSTLAMNIAHTASAQGAIVAVFSLEMSRNQLVLRLLSSEAEVDAHRLRLGIHGTAETNRIMAAVGDLSDLPIYIDDTPLQGVLEMRSKARRLHLERGIDLIIVDYLQLLGGGGRSENRVQELSEITRSLKGLARDLGAPVLAVSQLSRAVEMRPSHRPQLSDLRESGSIEQDADVVAFIYREDMYFSEEEWEQRMPEKPYPKDIAEIIVAKHRHGPIGSVNLFFRANMARFENLATEEQAW